MSSSYAATFRDLEVYRVAIEASMSVFELTRRFPAEERFSMVDQIRRSSRSVCANIGDAWRKRRYRAAFVAKLSDAEGEAAETQVWLDLARRCNYISHDELANLLDVYDHVLAQLVKMIANADRWIVSPRPPSRGSAS
ncbi:MAG: four helix bundle protein [Chloroflexi bacterium]|nr:four helix bundle protein [Chloroflexota bacterium]